MKKSYFSKLWTLCAAVAVVVFMSGCERIATGEVGLREAFNKTIEPTELRPGSLNQVLVGWFRVGVPCEANRFANRKSETADSRPLHTGRLGYSSYLQPESGCCV
jgi:hypothetical protein